MASLVTDALRIVARFSTRRSRSAPARPARRTCANDAALPANRPFGNRRVGVTQLPLAPHCKTASCAQARDSHDAVNHRVEHRGCQLTGLCILLTHVIAAEERRRRGRREVDEAAVGEDRARAGEADAGSRDVIEVGAPRDGPQGEHDAKAGQRAAFVVDEMGAARDLVGEGALPGGTQRTASATYTPRSTRPSSRAVLEGWLARPAR